MIFKGRAQKSTSLLWVSSVYPIRIACCGCISTYNEKEQPMVPATTWAMVSKQLKMEGFLVNRNVIQHTL